MKKIIFTVMLAIVSSVWTMSRAICMVEGTHLDGPIVSISGEIIRTAMPCGDEEPCADCLTLALSANEDIYYFSTTDPVVEKQLDSIYSVLISVNCICEQPAIVKGVLYTRGSFHYIAISTIIVLGDIQPKGWEPRFNSLCDEWNVLHEPFSCDGIYCRLQTLIYRLTRDTLIQDVNYVKLMEQEESNTYYKGAMREGTNRDIYYVPANSTHEYLLYAFNAQVGDTLSNLWVGGFGRDYQGVVQAISNGSPRIFTIGVKFGDESDDYLYPIRWIEGVGSPETPMGMAVVPDVPADIGVYTLLCAYKNGEQVYSSSKSERYGCEFNGIPSTKPYHLCDEWNVLSHSMSLGPEYESFKTLHFRLTSDTIINETRYVKLEQNGTYKGALREGTNANIYYVPNNSTHEYLLYAFNAQVGDSLDNLWFGANENENYFVSSATVVNIEPTTPRKFTIDFEWQSIYSYAAINDTSEIMHAELVWLEGLGFQYGGPLNYECPFDCAGAPGMLILCAYKNGEQVYTSDWGKKYGCEYNGEEQPRLKSLCDEWSLLVNFVLDGDDYYYSFKQYLTTDTVIGGLSYVKIEQQYGSYLGALREDDNRNIYFVHEGSDHEYLLYAFNAKVGDRLSNLWYGGRVKWCPNGYNATVIDISGDVFTVEVEYTYTDSGGEHFYPWPIYWVNGVGMVEGPVGHNCPGPNCAGDYGQEVLCAYNNGEQVYISEAGQKYGCEYKGEEKHRLKSLCDEWNVMEFRSHMGYAPDEYNMRHYHLTADTIIGEQRYSKLYKDNAYMGAIRERDNRDIYYIPADTTHEYLLYAFNAQIGEQLTNLWLGSITNKVFTKEYFPYGVNATVEEITETTPRRFVLSTGYITTEEGVENYPYYFEWIEGIGFASAPDGADYPLPYAGGFTSFLLCAYKNGEHIYTSEWGEQYGCEYNGDEVSSDTIPLYIKDNPGSSTVDPADPNLIYAVLEGDMLIIKDFTGAKILFILTNNGSSNSPARARRTQSQSFTDSTSVELTENGLYDIELTSESWNYIVVGSFDFNKIQKTIKIITDERRPAASKLLRNGQLLIRHGNQLYTPSGIQVQ